MGMMAEHSACIFPVAHCGGIPYLSRPMRTGALAIISVGAVSIVGGCGGRLLEAIGSASLPASGQLTIHHTSGVWNGTFAANVTYGMIDGNRRVHYDMNGALVTLPEEVADTSFATPR